MLEGLLSHSVPEKTIALATGDKQSLFLDAREKKEFDVSHIREAKWVGYKSFDPSLLNAVPKDSPIIVYCSIGYRSEKIAEKLKAAGFTNVSNLYGGIFEWVNQGNLVYNSMDQHLTFMDIRHFGASGCAREIRCTIDIESST
jgi:rhodanese-related sulfurtransferase